MNHAAAVGRLAASTLAVLLLVGCAGHADPSAPAAPRMASATAAGVEVAVATGAWRGWPSLLPTLVTPVQVRVANGSGVPLRLDARLFALALPDGRRLAAAPVDDVRAVVAEPPPTSRPVAGLTLGPLREQSGPGWALGEAAPDPRSDPSQEVSRTWELPSADMVQSALPQGTLAPGASASGFLYFERAPAGTAPVSLTARLVDARSDAPIGVVVVPLATE
jgi:hypothetical protein